ncbi:MAG: hypothetical protein LAT75_05555 [Candidatus Cyclonatronum sp.]|uniref:hypothetical protein n=1 Tax=Cyclonatronum sp. TaxID=3024185 RepID=UPI0025C362CC|nr:hypothetical protein [Cyclonatronum sp.]MCC5933184.1 hypothetical protein [Balneolales bacterium]MCH8486311.1 hypothetical protein [Cyclonatronum sp.]
MKTTFLIGSLAAVLFLSGCYTQLETIERPRGWNSAGQALSPYTSDAYSSFYSREEENAYALGYYNGVFDADLQFRSYNWNRHHASIGFHWGTPFIGYGFGSGYFYDPYWHHAMLYDPFFFSYYGVYAFPPHMRYRHWAHFNNPWWFGSRYIIVYNNWNIGSGNTDIVRGPRASGVHRGNVNNIRSNRTGSSGLAGDTRTRIRGNDFGPDAHPVSVRSRGGGTQPTSIDRRTRGGSATPSVIRRPAPSSTQATPPRTRGNNNTPSTGNRNSGSSSQGEAGRSRGGGSSGTQATPQRSSSGSNSSGTRTRNRNDNSDSPVSMLSSPLMYNGATFSLS